MKRSTLIIVIIFLVQTIFAGTLTQTYSFEKPQLKTENGLTEILFDNCKNMGEEGTPLLPQFAADILLPQNQEIVNVTIIEKTFYPGSENIRIKPASGHVPLSLKPDIVKQVIPNEDIYLSETDYPLETIKSMDTHFLSGHSIGSFTICPVVYHPSENNVEFIKEITVEIETQSTARALDAEKFLRNSVGVNSRIHKIIDNPDMLSSYTYQQPTRTEEYDLLIISNNTLLPAFADYIDFKESTGFAVATISTSDIYSQFAGQDNPEKIRNCIISYYTEYGISYVILGGDSDTNNSSDNIVPHRGLTADPGSGYEDTNIPGDIYYAGLDGNWNDDGDNRWGEPGEADLYEEVAVGRICADQAIEITNHTYKLRMYQDQPVVADIEKSLMVGEHLGFGGVSEYAANSKNEVAYGSSNHGYTTVGVSENFSIDELYEDPSYGGYSWPASSLYSQFNSTGVNLLNHLGHSSPDYNMKLYNSDLTTNNFSNDGITRGFVIGYSQGCYPGSFDNYHYNGYYMDEDCFAEKFTQLETGEVAFICNSRYGWGEWESTAGPSQYFDRQFFDAIFDEDITKIGEANGDSKEDNVAYINESGVIRFCAYELNLFGDPSMDIWTATPTNISANYPASVPIGSSTIAVQTGTEGARIAILQNDELIGRGVANSSGNATVQLFSSISTAQPLDISIIAHNKNRHYGTIFVVSDQPYVIFDNYEINDGNNGVAEFGEDITLDMSLNNVGNQNAYSVNVTISTDDEFVTITDNSENYGTVSAESVLTINNAFAFSVSNDIPDQHIVNFDLTATGTARDTWDSFFSITINAPELSAGNMIVDDSAGGDGNGRLDPGETAQITIPTTNSGNANSPSASASFTSASDYITIVDGFFDFGVIEAGTTENATFSISVSEDAPIGTAVSFGFVVEAGSYGFDQSFGTSIGLVLEDFETGDFSQFPWETNWEISGDAYEGSYSVKSTNNSDNTTSELSVQLEVTSNGTISFFRKVSSEANYDYLYFYIDGSLQDQWAGEVPWGEVSYPVTYGTHTFTWEYYKDQSVSNGSDCAWVDYIIFPPVGPGPEISVNPASFIETIPENTIETRNLNIANTGGGVLNYSIDIEETTSGRTSLNDVCIIDELTEEQKRADYLTKKDRIATEGLEIDKSITKSEVNHEYAPTSRSTDVTIICDGGDWQYEVGWALIAPNGETVATGSAPYSGDASLDNGIYTVNATDSYGDGWNGNYLSIVDTDGTVYLNYTLDYGSNGSTSFEVDALPPITWMTLSEDNGEVDGGTSENITVTFDTNGLTLGATYTANMIVDSPAGSVVVPISLTIGDAGPQSELSVNVGSVDEELSINQTATVDFEISNVGEVGSTLSYELSLDGVPDWASVNPSNGECGYGESDVIEVTFLSDGLEPGTYNSEITILSNGGSANLPISLVVHDCVNCPDWEVYIPEFEYNLTLTGLLFIEGEESFDENDMVGAFVGDELRGVASPSYFPLTGSYTVNLMIYSNESSGETVTFKAYDYSQDVIFENVIETINFVANDIIGNDLVPFEFHASGSMVQNLDFIVGWNWFSLNIVSSDMAMNSVLASLGSDATFIKNQSGYANYYDDFGWYGLDTFEITSMYMIDVTTASTLTVEGSPVDPMMEISLMEGWNWVSYLPQLTVDINFALESIEPNGTFIKNQTSYANYYDDFGWYGIESMNPGDGYMLLMNTEDVLVYNIPVGLVKVDNNEETKETKELHWSVNPHQFEYNMAITAELEAGSQLAVFVDDEVRGVVESTYFPLTDSYTANLMVYGNDGEELSFRVYQEANDTELEILDHLTFEVNGIIGNDIDPVLLRTISLPEDYSLSQNYPNPFNPSTTISYQLQATSSVLLAIYNVNGQLVETLVTGQLDAGYHSVVWNADDFASGVYIVKLTADGFTQTQKMLLMK